MKKILILCLFIILLSGCSVEYQLEIVDDEISENRIVEYSDKISSPYQYTLDLFASADDNGDILSYNRKKEFMNGFIVTNYYDDTSSYKEKSLLYGMCFESVSFEEDRNYITLDLSGRFLCYNTLNEMDNFTFSVKTNHKGYEDNADLFKSNTYSWDISKEDASNTNIHLVLYKDKYVYNYDNKILKRLGIVFSVICGTIVIGFLGYKFSLKISDRKNRF